jgi:hypothetical protein
VPSSSPVFAVSSLYEGDGTDAIGVKPLRKTSEGVCDEILAGIAEDALRHDEIECFGEHGGGESVAKAKGA